jgi:hypothetical protein
MGVSVGSYYQEADQPWLGGMVKGKADVPQLSTQQSDAMLKAHMALAAGLCIHSPSMRRAISHNSIAFADNTDGHVSIASDSPNAIQDMIEKLQHSAQTWSNLVDICGGLVALHKCTWQLIAWTNEGGVLSMLHDAPRPLHMDNGKGSRARVDYLPPHQPNVGLGYQICPDGSQAPQFTVLYEALCGLCNSVASAHLTEPETCLLLRQQITPKLQYTLHTTSFSRTQCSRLDTLL